MKCLEALGVDNGSRVVPHPSWRRCCHLWLWPARMLGGLIRAPRDTVDIARSSLTARTLNPRYEPTSSRWVTTSDLDLDLRRLVTSWTGKLSCWGLLRRAWRSSARPGEGDTRCQHPISRAGGARVATEFTRHQSGSTRRCRAIPRRDAEAPLSSSEVRSGRGDAEPEVTEAKRVAPPTRPESAAARHAALRKDWPSVDGRCS